MVNLSFVEVYGFKIIAALHSRQVGLLRQASSITGTSLP